MRRTRQINAVPILAGLLAAVVLLTSAGCGFCLFDFTCGPGCCVDFRCREVKDCPLMVVPIKSKNPPPHIDTAPTDTAAPNSAQP